MYKIQRLIYNTISKRPPQESRWSVHTWILMKKKKSCIAEVKGPMWALRCHDQGQREGDGERRHWSQTKDAKKGQWRKLEWWPQKHQRWLENNRPERVLLAKTNTSMDNNKTGNKAGSNTELAAETGNNAELATKTRNDAELAL